MWNFKGNLWNSIQNILPTHWKIRFLYIEILRALSFKSSYVFLKRPPDYTIHGLVFFLLSSLFPDSTKPLPGDHFTNNFSITIQMWWKFHFAIIQILIKWSLQSLAHGTTAGLSWHVPNVVAIWSPVIELELNEISIKFELWWKNC